MFIHAVLFRIAPKEVPKYRRDNAMWQSYAQKAKGFVAYRTMQHIGQANQYASVYEWETKRNHDTFMKRFHDYLVSKSKAKVTVLGYFNLKKLPKP